MNYKKYVEEVCSKCENKLNDKDLCDIRTTINGKANCVNYKEKTKILKWLSMIKIYHHKNKKSKYEKTKIKISFKSKYQTSLFMIIREYYDKKTNEITYAEILFEIE